MNITDEDGSFLIDAAASFLIIALLVGGISLVSGRASSAAATFASRSAKVKHSATLSKRIPTPKSLQPVALMKRNVR